MKYQPDLDVKQADHLLSRAFRVLVKSDIHPWAGIETELWNAVAGISFPPKVSLLYRIMPIFMQAQNANVRRLSEEMHEFVVTYGRGIV